MRKLFLFLTLIAFLSSPVYGQTTATGKIVVATSSTLPATCSGGDVVTTTDLFKLYTCGPANTWSQQTSAVTFSGAPTGSCTASQVAVDTTTGNFYSCNGGSWLLVGPGGGAVSWASLTSGTNNSGAFLVGTGSSLAASGSGTITATAVPWTGITSFPSACVSGQFVKILASTPTCAQPAYSQISGTPTIYYQLVGYNGASQTARNRINLIPGTNITITPVDNSGTNSTDVTITAAGAGSIYYQNLGVNGSTQTQRNRLNLIPGSGITVSNSDNSGSGSSDVTISATNTGTVTTTGSPALNNLTCFSGGTSITNCNLSGAVTTSGTSATTLASNAVASSNIQSGAVGATQLASQYSKMRCEPGLGDGLNVIPSGTYLQTTCYNDSGVTWTLTGFKCFTDNNGSSTMNATNSGGTGLLTGAITCNNSFASGTQSGTTTIASGGYIKFTFVSDGSSKQTTWVVSMTQ